MQIRDYFVKGDIKGAIEFMRGHEEFKDILPAYIAIFENCEYRTFEIPDLLNDILRLYQVYFRDVFYCALQEEDAACKLLTQLKSILNITDADETILVEKLQSVFCQNGFHTQFGKTQGYYGPYIWRYTEPTTYQVELPSGMTEYTVNILKDFVFCSWMDYLTFGRFGTKGWASPDGTINCVEHANDMESEQFRISLLKHEAQHVFDMKQFPGITNPELEYRAKLVELIYSNNPGLLQKFLSEANESRIEDGHAMASLRFKSEFANTDQTIISKIQTKAQELLEVNNEEMEEKYGKTINNAY